MNGILQKNITQSFDAHPLFQGLPIAIHVEAGVVVITGFVDAFPKKALAVQFAKSLSGTRKIQENLGVKLGDSHALPDRMIHTEVIACFEKNFGEANKNIKVYVADGHVNLAGMFKWKYQYDLAVECISHIAGIRSITNRIEVMAIPDIPVLREKDILAIIYSQKAVTTSIDVALANQVATLSGSVLNTVQKKIVEAIVANIPGVAQVVSLLTIQTW